MNHIRRSYPIITLLIPLLFHACRPPGTGETARGPHPAAEKGLLVSVEYAADKISSQTGGTDIRPKLALLYLHSRDIERALETARSIEDRNDRARTIGLIGEYLVEIGNREQAESVANSIQVDYFKSSVLARIALSYEEAGEYRRGRELAEEIPDPNFKARALSGIAVQYHREGYGDLANRIFRQAIQAAETEQSITHRIETLVYLAVKHNQSERQSRATELFQEAVQLAEKISGAQQSLGSWTVILSYYRDAGQGTRVIDRADEYAGTQQDGAGFFTNELQSAVAAAYARSGAFAKAEEILSDLEDAAARALLAAHITISYAERNNAPETERFFSITQNNIESITVQAFRERIITESARAFAEAGHPGRAAALARLSRDGASKSRSLAGIAIAYHKLGELELAETTLTEALDTLTGGEDRYETAVALSDLADAYLSTGIGFPEEQRDKLSMVMHAID